MPNTFTSGHALLIGVDSYVNAPQINVPITARDAQAVRQVLINPALCGYPDAQVNILSDARASKAGILAALDRLAAQTVPESTVLVFYAGHGDSATDGNYNLVPHDIQLSDGKVTAGSGITVAELLDKLRRIPAKRLLLFFNACHSGNISPTLDLSASKRPFGSLGLPTPAAEAILASGEGRILITACRAEQYSYFPLGDGKLTYFTQALVDGLSGKGYVVARQGYISAFGLYEHLYLTVKEKVQPLGGEQEPELTVLRGVGPFPVALYCGATALGVFDASEPLPPDTAARQVDPARSQRFFQVVTGGGVGVQGNNNRVVGPGGIMVGGSVGGSIISGSQVSHESITVGNISNATGVAIGKGAQARVSQKSVTPDEGAEEDDDAQRKEP